MFQAIDMHVYRQAVCARDCIHYLCVIEDYCVNVTYTKIAERQNGIYHGRQETL